MTFTEEQRKEVRHMVETHPGWKVLEEWIDEVVGTNTEILIDHEDPAIRGEIKAFKRLRKKINDSLRHYEKETKEED
jgi:hypothetical protein